MDNSFIQRTLENSVPQSQVFMVEILPLFWRYLTSMSRGQYTLLDVGPGAGGGAELLASIHCSSFLGYRIGVDTMDISNRYKEFIQTHCKNIKNQ